MNVGLDLGAGGWLGGQYYLRNLVLAVGSLPEHEQPRLVGVGDPSGDLAGLLDIRQELPADVDVVFPNWTVHNPAGGAELGWLPDLQHRGLPHHFSRFDRLRRDIGFRRSARQSTLIVVSSNAVRKDVERAYASAPRKLRVVHFTTVVPDEVLEKASADVVARYALPTPFVLLPNQFWTHKNHRTAFEALREIDVPLVCTGDTTDHRNPGHFDSLLEFAERTGIRDRIHVLGVVPRQDYLQLVRAARVVLQPSLFEGWSSIVEDARAFGKAIVMSDIPVHREQRPSGASFFPPQDAAALARALREALDHGPPLAEEAAIALQRERVADYARSFLSVASEAAELAR